MTEDQMTNPDEGLKIIAPILEGPSSVVTNRVLLGRLKQDSKSITSFAEDIRLKALDCDFENSKVRDMFCAQSFINGLSDPYIVQELMKTMNHSDNFEKLVTSAVNLALAKDASLKLVSKDRFEIFALGKTDEINFQEVLDKKDSEICKLKATIDNFRAAN